MSRQLNDYTQELQETFKDISPQEKYKIIGSANLKALRYPSDYDLNEDVRQLTHAQFAKKIKQIFVKAMKDENLYITDFKCGVEKNKTPIRWSYAEIAKGKSRSGVSILEALKQRETTKLDMIAIIDNQVTELSNNFIFEKQATPADIKKSLKLEIKEKKAEGKYFKALKRVFSLRTIEGKSNSNLLDYFNGDTGLANKCRSDLDTLVVLLEQKFRPVPLKLVKSNIQLIKYELSGSSQLDISEVFDRMMTLKTPASLIKRLKAVSKDISEMVDDDAKRMLLR